MKTAIVTDSNCGITVEQAAQLGIEIQPTPVLVNGEQFFEEECFTQERFYESLTNPDTSVATSQPNPFDVAGAYNQKNGGNRTRIYRQSLRVG